LIPKTLANDESAIQAWQYMESSPGAGLNSAFFAQYDAYVQAILASGPNVNVILDLHSETRFPSGLF